MHHEETLHSNLIYQGRVFRVTEDKVRLENDKISTREVVHHNGAVCIAALDDQDRLLFVRQFRHPFQQELLELPAGKRDGDEEPLLCGQRELEEECGCTADRFTSLGMMYPTVGYCNEIIHLYLAEGLHSSQQNLDEDEFLDVEAIPFETALNMVLQNQIPDAKTQLAILKIHALRHTK